MGKLMRLGRLTSSIVGAITPREQPARLTPQMLFDAELPLCWQAQRQVLGLG